MSGLVGNFRRHVLSCRGSYEIYLPSHFNFMYGYDKCSIAFVLKQVTANVNLTSKESSITLPGI